MEPIDQELRNLLSNREDDLLPPMYEEAYYSEVISSLQGDGAALTRLTWVGIFLFGGLLIYCVYRFVIADTVNDQVFFGCFAIMLNSAQIALKLWYNMRLNRRAIINEIRHHNLAN
ncbi:MAG: DUF6768 family protein [Woeseiaceae bacterium]